MCDIRTVLDTLKTGVAVVNMEEKIGIEAKMLSEDLENINEKYPCVYFNNALIGGFKSLFEDNYSDRSGMVFHTNDISRLFKLQVFVPLHDVQNHSVAMPNIEKLTQSVYHIIDSHDNHKCFYTVYHDE